MVNNHKLNGVERIRTFPSLSISSLMIHQQIPRPLIKHYFWFILPLLFATPINIVHFIVKGAQSWLNGLKSSAKLFNCVVCNPCQSSPSLTILVLLWFTIVSLMSFYLCKVLFSGFLQFNGNFVDAQNNSKYCDCAPLTLKS